MKRIVCLLFLLCPGVTAWTQAGGERTFAFMELNPAPRVAAMGGVVNAICDGDVSLTYVNPSLLNGQMHRTLALSYVDYLADVRYGYAAFGYHVPSVGTFSSGIHYINYGSFIEADENGTITGSFSAAEYAVHFSYGRPVTLFDITLQAGISLKPVFSHLETYTSFGLAIDAGLTYCNEQEGLTAAFVVRNAGLQCKTYAGHRESLPIDVQLGMTKSLDKAPILFSVVLQHLETTHLRTRKQFLNENTGMMEWEHESRLERFGQEMWRHVVMGVEVMPIDGFFFRAGYNPLRREELQVKQMKSTVGFSWGAGLRIRPFLLEYANAKYHLASSTHQLSILWHIGTKTQ